MNGSKEIPCLKFKILKCDAVWAKHRTHHLPDDAKQMCYVLCHGIWGKSKNLKDKNKGNICRYSYISRQPNKYTLKVKLDRWVNIIYLKSIYRKQRLLKSNH